MQLLEKTMNQEGPGGLVWAWRLKSRGKVIYEQLTNNQQLVLIMLKATDGSRFDLATSIVVIYIYDLASWWLSLLSSQDTN